MFIENGFKQNKRLGNFFRPPVINRPFFCKIYVSNLWRLPAPAPPTVVSGSLSKAYERSGQERPRFIGVFTEKPILCDHSG